MDFKAKMAEMLASGADLSALAELVNAEAVRVKAEEAALKAANDAALRADILARLNFGPTMAKALKSLADVGCHGIQVTLTEDGAVAVKPMLRAAATVSTTPGVKSQAGTGKYVGDKATWLAEVSAEQRAKDIETIKRLALLKEGDPGYIRSYTWHTYNASIKAARKIA